MEPFAEAMEVVAEVMRHGAATGNNQGWNPDLLHLLHQLK